jgi:Helix-turn-helix domain
MLFLLNKKLKFSPGMTIINPTGSQRQLSGSCIFRTSSQMTPKQGAVAVEQIDFNKEAERPLLPAWFTREETAQLLGVTVRTVDRIRKRGCLVDLDPSGTVRISKESIEQYMRRPVEPSNAECRFISLDAEHYDTVLLELQHRKAESKRLEAVEHELEVFRSENEQLRNKIKAVIVDANRSITIWSLIFGKRKP